MCSLRLLKNASAPITSAPVRFSRRVAKAASSSRSVLAATTSRRSPSAPVAAARSRVWGSARTGLFGLTRSPKLPAAGTTARSSSSCFAPTFAPKVDTPVRLPPGRLRLGTRPSSTGSTATRKTTGTVVVAALAAIADGVLPRTTITMMVFGLVLLATIRRAQAQGLSKVFRIGIVSPINLRSAPQFLAFEDRLREVGYVEGRNLTIEFLYLEGRLERYPEAMAELLRRQVDVVIAGGQEAALKAAKEATSTIPIVDVAIDYDPFGSSILSAGTILSHLLQDAGHHVLEAHDGVEAIAILELRSGDVSALFSEFAMPRTRMQRCWQSSRHRASA